MTKKSGIGGGEIVVSGIREGGILWFKTCSALLWLAVERPSVVIPLLFNTNGRRNHSSAFVGAPFLTL